MYKRTSLTNHNVTAVHGENQNKTIYVNCGKLAVFLKLVFSSGKMFRKAKQTVAPLPKPPTEAQMLEDLQLFHETKPAPQHISSENLPTLTEESSMDDWWKVYDATVQHHEQFRELKTNAQELKQTLQEMRSQLQAACDKIMAEINQDLERLGATMSE